MLRRWCRSLIGTLQRLPPAADGLQQRHPWLALPVATWKKFGDDEAGSLAALIAYAAFVSVFPLVLVLVTVLELVLANHPALRSHVLSSAFSQFPVIGPQLRASVHGLHSTGLALAVGLVGAVLGACGLAAAVQKALNTAWEVPHDARPGFPWSLLRSLAMMTVVGPGEIAAILLAGIAGNLIGGTGARIGVVAVSLVLNAALFWLAFRLATAARVRTRDLRLGAILAAISWQALQAAGEHIVSHDVAKSSALYGVFAIVLGLLAWLYLQAQITLYAVELSVVRVYRLRPRSLFPPPLTQADVRAYELYAKVEQRRPEFDVELEPADDDSEDAPARASGNDEPLPSRESRG